ncbi:lysophospholipid acyltransferase family protein [Tanticharoenia sakaeratensis]|uniref:Lipid A biosynthesis acyltransferase n=1 Tax=Tanticharoenia sakaeratensis NBRC 103193 TaxID=1231623 RepID=A0A0D6MNZ0_9PROT|nr:lauroyl acyltransferase [Tanticharoenia sakaeratensis]GAN55384.1 lipid A biosynthesis acyltransferase [Tanticharoenia sakaeratensis NBRC 103193]GBQ22222.1 lipid A biosynthesis lauroyl acyltransferase [Tanticharoenia sakaeratensis NBRC 103193]
MTTRLQPTHRLSYRVLSVVLRGAIGCLRLAGASNASAAGGYLARTIGMRLRATSVAERNLRQAMPELDAAGRRAVIRDVWDNLGRTVAELPHLRDFRRTASGPGWEIEGEAHIRALQASNRQALFFSGHLGNWELILPIASRLGLPVSGFYRESSNPVVDRVVQAMRRRALNPDSKLFPKGAYGARQAVSHLQRGGSLGFLVDQKMNDGVAIPFFGRDAMTAPAVAQLALRFDLPIIPVQVLRLGGGRFRMVCEAPLDVARSGTRQSDIRAICIAMNETLERWIRARPGSWLWVHRRWPKEAG